MAGLKVRQGKAEPDATAPATSPTAAKDDNRTEYADDSKGRQIGARQLDPCALFDITIALGDAANNQAALNQALMACSVVEIDGERLPRPANLIQIRARMQLLGFHGYDAARQALAKFTVEDDEAGEVAAKNS
jgi:hypothetical protein